MTYNNVQAMLNDVKAFTLARKRVLDKRAKSHKLVVAQLEDAYRVACVVQNHLRVAERNEMTKGAK